jgi:sec-independent protein translocase protein TatB
MFDIGFWELIIIAVVALLVVGPERLPGLIKDVLRWSRAIQRFVVSTKRDIERELDFDVQKDLNARLEDLDDLMEIAPDKDGTPVDRKQKQA